MTEPKIILTKNVKKDPAKEKKRKQQIIILGSLLLFFFYLLFSTFMGMKKKAPPPPAQTAAPQVQPGTNVSKPAGISKAQDEEKMDWGKSPFSLKETAEPVKETSAKSEVKTFLQLQGILMDEKGESLAIINENVVKKGDKIADNTVKDITPDEVTLENSKGETVKLHGN